MFCGQMCPRCRAHDTVFVAVGEARCRSCGALMSFAQSPGAASTSDSYDGAPWSRSPRGARASNADAAPDDSDDAPWARPRGIASAELDNLRTSFGGLLDESKEEAEDDEEEWVSVNEQLAARASDLAARLVDARAAWADAIATSRTRGRAAPFEAAVEALEKEETALEEETVRERSALCRPVFHPVLAGTIERLTAAAVAARDARADLRRRVKVQMSHQSSPEAMALEGGKKQPVHMKAWSTPVTGGRNAPPLGVIEMKCLKCSGAWWRRFGPIYDSLIIDSNSEPSKHCPTCGIRIPLRRSDFGLERADNPVSERDVWGVTFQ